MTKQKKSTSFLYACSELESGIFLFFFSITKTTLEN